MKTKIRATVTLNSFESGVIAKVVLLALNGRIKTDAATVQVPLTVTDITVMEEFIAAHEKVISLTLKS